ncbi:MULTISPECIES: hypothetical protein [Streptomyces]|uniref:hypothetical protein n=1 Tax=Streptomyces TaxID=1883 RepID=UPI0004C92DF2|nr:hypothetical protein [Streptomyces sp. NRRL S-237]
MKSLDLVRIEAGLHDWKAMKCGCSWSGRRNSAEHIPAGLIEMLEGGSPPLGDAWAENHAYIQSNLMEPAVATTSLVVAALAGRPPVAVRHELLWSLTVLTSGEQADVADACLDVVREATWILYEELAAGEQVGTSGLAYELLLFMEEQEERRTAYRRLYAAHLPAHLK